MRPVSKELDLAQEEHQLLAWGRGRDRGFLFDCLKAPLVEADAVEDANHQRGRFQVVGVPGGPRVLVSVHMSRSREHPLIVHSDAVGVK